MDVINHMVAWRPELEKLLVMDLVCGGSNSYAHDSTLDLLYHEFIHNITCVTGLFESLHKVLILSVEFGE